MMDEPQVSFITVCYNDFKDTCESIESLQTHVHFVGHEIIVVNNASREDEATKIRELYLDTVILRGESNLGLSGRNSLGIRVAKGIYISLTSSDTYAESDGFHYLTERLGSQKDVGAVPPKVCFAFPPQNIQFVGFASLSAIAIRNEITGFSCLDDGTFDTPYTTPYLHGATPMVKRKVVEKVREILEIFFLYYEEMDWCTRMTNTGYEPWYKPRCTVFHKESQSTGQFSKLRTFYTMRNRLLYIRRNRKGIQWLLSILCQSTIAAGKNSFQFVVKGRFDLFAAVWKGAVRSLSVTSPIRQPLKMKDHVHLY